jgi:pimeloyl-ACP methyl ester carboxylesterase
LARQSTTTVDELTVDIYLPEGDGVRGNLVLCHGAWVGAWIWEEFAVYLADRGYRCFAPTWRGHYDSKPVPDLGKVSLLDYVKDLLTVYDQVGGEVLIGESAGGLIAQKAAEGHPGVKGMILMNPAPPFMVPANPRLVMKQLKYLPDLLLGRPNLPREKDYKQLILNNVPEPEASEFYRKICPDSGRALKEMSMGKIRADPAKIHCPVHVVVGHLDAVLPAKVHHRTAALYGATVADYPSMSHHTFSEDGWQQVADELVVWLAEKLEPAA